MEIKPVPITRFRGIANTGLSPQDLMGKGFLASAENVDLTDTGGLQTRNGSQSVYTAVDGSIHSLWASPSICLLREGTYLKQLNIHTMTASTIRSGLTSSLLPMAYLDIVGITYYSDGLNTGAIVGGVNRSLGLDVPPLPIAYVAGSGTLVAGTYQTTIAYVRNDGQMSGAPTPAILQVASDNQAITLSNIPTSSDSTVIYIDIFLSSPSGEGVYFYDRITNGVTNYTISHNQNTAGLPLSTINATKPPAGDMLEYYNGTLFVVVGNIIYYSMPLAYELFNPKNYLILPSECTMLAAVRDGLWVGTKETAAFYGGDQPPFKIVTTLDCGAIKFTQAKIPGNLILPELTDQVVMWSSPKGVFIGGNNGFNLHRTPNVKLPVANTGRVLFRQDKGINQYLVSLVDSTANQEVTTPLKAEVNVTLPALTGV